MPEHTPPPVRSRSRAILVGDGRPRPLPVACRWACPAPDGPAVRRPGRRPHRGHRVATQRAWRRDVTAGHDRAARGPGHPWRARGRAARAGHRHHRQQRQDHHRAVHGGAAPGRGPARAPQPHRGQPGPGRDVAGGDVGRPARPHAPLGDGHGGRRGRPAPRPGRAAAAGRPRDRPVPRPARSLRGDLCGGRCLLGGRGGPACRQRPVRQRRRSDRGRPGGEPPGPARHVRPGPGPRHRPHHPRRGHDPLSALPRRPRLRARLPEPHGRLALSRVRSRPAAARRRRDGPRGPRAGARRRSRCARRRATCT